MNWASLLLAVVFGTPAVVMFLRHKAPRVAAIFAALAVLCLLSGVPSLLRMLGHPIGPGPVLLGIVAATIVFVMFFYWDFFHGEHKKPLFARKGGAPGQAGGGGGHNHHIRPLVTCVGLTVCGLMVALNWTAVVTGTSHGFSQTVNSITRQQ
jgi:hypothetical protein